ncbi:MAG TPA: Rpn family recombination-promoting nuclease/putative transposase [Rectinemataceae bacterium]|nr:Rpn family recombination-promoting nuclease/putative transposase [Rectinemataceae bacterium]
MRTGIKPTVDVVFKKIFGSRLHEGITLDFLNALLPLVGLPEAAELHIANPFRLGDFEGDKEIAVDIHIHDREGREFQIEMQVRRDNALGARMLDNWARLYSGQIAKGHDYRLHRPVIAIWILSHSFFEDGDWLHAFRISDGKRARGLGEDFLIVTIELPKGESLSIAPNRTKFDSGMGDWLWFLSHGQDIDPESANFGALRKEIREAVEIMRVFTKAYKARYTYDRRLEWERTINAWKNDAREEGLEEGRSVGRELGLAEGREKGLAEGKAEGKAEGERVKAQEDARRLKALGVSLDIISKATGLSESEIESL